MASGGNHPEPEKTVDTSASASTGTGGGFLEDTEFQCCVCLDLLYKPVVLACGHMSCFWCVQKAMGLQKSHCPVCRQPYKHFPSICQLLHHLLLKLEPAEYERRGNEILEEENHMETYSPQIIELNNSKNNDGETGLKDGNIRPPPEAPSSSNIVNDHSKKIELEDVSCPLCKKMLYEPAVLNCGHVYCVSCLSSLNEETVQCHVCGGLHPGDIPNVCLDLDHFLEEYFPSEYEYRRMKVQFEKHRCNTEASSSGTALTKESSRQHDDEISNVHAGIGCDSCGVYPIHGKRYKCQDCTELIGFDLCEKCYSSSSNLPGRFNQQHTPDHRMELVDANPLHTLMRFGMMTEEEAFQMIQDVAAIEEAVVAPDMMVGIIIDDQEMDDNDDQHQPL